MVVNLRYNRRQKSSILETLSTTGLGALGAVRFGAVLFGASFIGAYRGC